MPQRQVVPNAKGGWNVPGLGKFDTQRDAAAAARQDLKTRGGGELTISGRDGKIRAKDTIAPKKDPRRSKG